MLRSGSQGTENKEENPNLTNLNDLNAIFDPLRSPPPGEPAKPPANTQLQGNGQPAKDPWEGLDIPASLRRDRPRVGAPAISAGPDDDLGDLQ